MNTCVIANPFDAIYFRRTSDDYKAETAAESTKRISQSRAYLTADRYHDLLACKRARSTVIASSYSHARPGELAAADHTISSFADLLAFL